MDLNIQELNKDELKILGGDSSASMLGLGLASCLMFFYGGGVGMALAYYNYYKD